MSRLLPCSLALATALLAACAGPQIAGVEPIDGVISGQCHTDMVRGAVGLAASDATLQRARVDSETTTGGSRLTIETGRNNAITGMSCG
jgi:hypothetical protein